LNSTGGDSREVLAELGVSADEFAELETSGVVFVATDEE